jgi:catalase
MDDRGQAAGRDGAEGSFTGNANVDAAVRRNADTRLTTEQGVAIADDQNSLRVGATGPTLLEDFAFREKLTHFDHERIPERVVHARGSGAHGVFQVYEPLSDLTTAAFLNDPSVETPVFVRFSQVAGSLGAMDTARDVRGFATKFYTRDGNFDLVGNNIPVFFIQDAIKFPDLIHATKPEPNNQIPQDQTAHDTFWDFTWLTPESAHMILWLMSDRGIPRSYRMMEGFGVHTFRLINAERRSQYVKFHWKPKLGVHALVWDEAQKLGGKDPDFLRRDLWEAIELGNYPEWELGLQLIPEGDEGRYPFDIRDATKIWPEELVPVRRVGRLTLNRNPQNFFAETEQVAFHIGNLVPGIDVTDDPLLQGRLFSYLDTQLIRLGGPNFTQIPINRPLTDVFNNQREGWHQHRVDSGRVNYSPNSLADGAPRDQQRGAGGFHSFPEQLAGQKVRERGDSFRDHFSQATLFWNSMTEPEQEHIVLALRFELGHVVNREVRERMVDLLTNVDLDLAARAAEGIGVAPPASSNGTSALAGANERLRAGWERFGTTSLPGERREAGIDRSPALSMLGQGRGMIESRKVAVLLADGVDTATVAALRAALQQRGALAEVIAPRLGTVRGASGGEIHAANSVLTMASVMYDGVFVPGGRESVQTLRLNGDAVHFVAEAFKHGKPVGASGEGLRLLDAAGISYGTGTDDGVATGDDPGVVQRFIEALGEHRFFLRQAIAHIPA